MRGKRVHFFADKNDLDLIFRTAEAERDIYYVKFGMFDTREPPQYNSFFDYEDLGINRRGQHTNSEIMFLVMDKTTQFWATAIPQVAGGTKYAVDQRDNPGSVVLTPSGFYDANTLIAGELGTISDNAESLAIIALFRKIIKKNSVQVGYARVCAGAMEFMKNGGRMVTMGIDSPREYDLKFQ